MKVFLGEIISGVFSGRAYPASSAFFDLAFLVFLLATVAYLVYLAGRKDLWWKIGVGASAVAAVLMTLALAFRWVAAGWDHPPFTNLYESLVFFAWGIVVLYLFLEWRYQVKVAGAFIIPLACITMGLASLSPNKAIEPLVPALQSIWLHLHVMVASIGYAAFLAAFAFAVLYFVKDKVRLEWFVLTVGAFTVLAILAATKGSVFTLQYLTDAFTMKNGVWIKKALPATAHGAQPIIQQIVVPGVGSLLLLSLITGLVAVGNAIFNIVKTEESLSTISQYAVMLTFALFTLSMIVLLVQLGRMPAARLAGNPYSFAMLVLVWLGWLFALIATQRYDSLVEALPPVKTLDRMTYNTVMIGFPLMTLVIITGAIWANQAWGRYWGWDPKETASLVTWLIYLLFLHTRLTQGWTGRRSMIIAVIGFASVVFTYLGVNLLLSGLHAYATG